MSTTSRRCACLVIALGAAFVLWPAGTDAGKKKYTAEELEKAQEAYLPDLMTAWCRGWTVSRGTPAPVEIPGGLRVDVGQPNHRVRHVLHSYDPSTLARRGRELTAPGTWIKASGDPVAFRAALPAAWTMGTAGYLMTAPLRAGRLGGPLRESAGRIHVER